MIEITNNWNIADVIILLMLIIYLCEYNSLNKRIKQLEKELRFEK